MPSDSAHSAVVHQHLPVQRADRESESVLEEGRELGVGVLEGRVSLAERPDRAGEPVARARVRGVGQLHRLRGRVQTAVGLHPQHDVARVRSVGRLQVRERAQELVSAVAALLRAGQAPVAQVHDGRTRDVVGVVRPLSPRVGRLIEGAAADPLERAAGPRVGVGPRQDERRLVGEPVGRVPFDVRRRRRLVEQEVEVREVRERRGRDRGGCRRPLEEGCGCRRDGAAEGHGDRDQDGEHGSDGGRQPARLPPWSVAQGGDLLGVVVRTGDVHHRNSSWRDPGGGSKNRLVPVRLLRLRTTSPLFPVGIRCTRAPAPQRAFCP